MISSESRRIAAAKRRYETAVSLHKQGRLDEAETHYQALRRTYPRHPGVLHGLGLIWMRAGRAFDAVDALEQAAAAAPADGVIRSDLGRAYLAAGRYEDAVGCLTFAQACLPQDVALLIPLGEALNVLGRHAEAEDVFDKAIRIDARIAPAHYGLGNIHAQAGRVEEARSAYARAIALAPRQPAYHRALAELERFRDDDPRLGVLESLASNEQGLTDDQRAELHFALAKAYDDLDRHDAAFERWRTANAIKRRNIDYDEKDVATYLAGIAAAFTTERVRAPRNAGHPSELPIFVVGMPRSGTSLIEQILASHSDVFGAGELPFIGDQIGRAGWAYPVDIAALPGNALAAFGAEYAGRLKSLAPEAKRIVDKLPANFRHLGLIHLALPHARIIHVRRDPMDTCFSCYTKLFPPGSNFSYDLGELGRYHKLYATTMAHWRTVLLPGVLLEVEYESLLANFEPEVRRLLEFCALPWEARCLRFFESGRAVRTLSRAQVRQPLFTSSVGRWRRYERWLGPLRDALA